MPPSTPTSAPVTSLADVERVVGAWCEAADPALHTGADAVVVVERLAKVVLRLQAAQAGFVERVDACRSQPRASGSPEEFFARQNGISVHAARQAIDTARRLKHCPTTAEAFKAGELSIGEADAVSAAAIADPSAEHDLLARAAKTHDLSDIRERAAKVKAAAHQGESREARRQRLRAKRRWSEFPDDEMTAVAARFLPEEFALVAPVIDAYTQPIFEQARTDGVRDPSEAYRADGVLAALAAAGTLVGLGAPNPVDPATTPATSPKKVRWNVTVLVDAIALKRGHATAKETCEIVGVGPVDVAWINQILPEALVDVIVHDLNDITAYTTTTRYRKRALEKALIARDRCCVVPGCKRRRRLQRDHRHDFALGGPTSGENMDLLCDVHHYEKTHQGARLERTTTEWLWYPPDPKDGDPEPAPGSIPWRAPIGEHLTPFDLTDLPPPTLPFE